MPRVSKKAARSQATKPGPTTPPGKKRRGGRKPGVWTLVQPEQIRSYRAENKLSRLTFAKLVGVSNTTVQNWETSKGPAHPRVQERIKALLEGGATASAPTSKAMAAASQDAVVAATGQIVAAFLGNAKVQRGELGEVIREVRSALAQ